MPLRLRRRSVLGMAAAAAIPLTGCTTQNEPVPTSSPSATEPDPSADLALQALVADHERSLLAQYAATIAAHPSLASSLAPLAEQHQAHLDALQSPPTPTTGNPAASSVPTEPTAAIAQLAAAERAAADERTSACEQAMAIDLTRLLALIAASEASHAEALTSSGTGP